MNKEKQTPREYIIKEEFNQYLDSLDPEIYNLALEEFGTHFSLRFFSALVEVDGLDEQGLNRLENYIILFKTTVKETIQKRIIELINML